MQLYENINRLSKNKTRRVYFTTSQRFGRTLKIIRIYTQNNKIITAFNEPLLER